MTSAVAKRARIACCSVVSQYDASNTMRGASSMIDVEG